jgi:hypothetical protein
MAAVRILLYLIVVVATHGGTDIPHLVHPAALADIVPTFSIAL